MRTVNFVQEIVYGMAHLLGIDTEQDLLKDHARAWVASINSKVRYGWTFWPWPELEITEERAFRQVWYTDVQYRSSQGDESDVYYLQKGAYYRAKIFPDVIGPPIGTLPTNINYWDPVPANEINPHVAFDQFGKRQIELVTAVNRSDPRSGSNGRYWDFSPTSRGIDLPFASGPTVWLTYQPPPPVFTSTTWTPDKGYARGDVVLDRDTGDCSIAVAPSTNKTVDLVGYWLRQDFPYFLSEYVKYDAAADQTDDLPSKADLRAQAQEALICEVRKLTRQGQRTKYRPFGLGTRRRVSWPEVALVT